MTATIHKMLKEDDVKIFKPDPAEPSWLTDLRGEAFAEFGERGFPTIKDEDWKYTNVRPLIGGMTFEPVENGPRSNDLSKNDRQMLERFAFDRNGFAAQNLALGTIESFTIEGEQSGPLVLDPSIEEGPNTIIHRLVTVRPGTTATLIETYSSRSARFVNTAIQIVLEDNAQLMHYRVQRESAETFQYGMTDVLLGRDSTYNSTNISFGGVLTRHDINVKFTAEGGEAYVDGLYMLDGNQHHDTHSVIDHAVPNCISHQTYKGVLNGRSRGVFNGKVFVREDAHGTDARQSNKNLLLSNEARVDTKPQLEIFNDDVKCSHGATVGQLEDEELFYLLTRGLPAPLARNLLTYGFAEEIINKITAGTIKEELDAVVLNRLDAAI